VGRVAVESVRVTDRGGGGDGKHPRLLRCADGQHLEDLLGHGDPLLEVEGRPTRFLL